MPAKDSKKDKTQNRRFIDAAREERFDERLKKITSLKTQSGKKSVSQPKRPRK